MAEHVFENTRVPVPNVQVIFSVAE